MRDGHEIARITLTPPAGRCASLAVVATPTAVEVRQLDEWGQQLNFQRLALPAIEQLAAALTTGAEMLRSSGTKKR